MTTIVIGLLVVLGDVTKAVWRGVVVNLAVGREGVVDELLKNLVVLEGTVLGVVVAAGVGACVGAVFRMLSFRPKKLEKS